MKNILLLTMLCASGMHAMHPRDVAFQVLKQKYEQHGFDPGEQGIVDFDPTSQDLFELVGSGDTLRLEQALQAGWSRTGLKQKGHTLRQFAEKMNNGTLQVLDQYDPPKARSLF